MPVHTSAIWEGFIPGAEQGQLYKYLIETNEGEKLYKADPYAFKAECLRVPPACCGPSTAISGTTPRGSSAAPATTTCRSRSTSTRCILARGSATATRRRASRTSTATTPAPWTFPRAARRVLHLRRPVGGARGLRARHGLHAYRGHAAYGASLRWLLGLPDDRLLRRHVALRQPAAAHAFYRCMPRGRHWRDHGLGARRFLRRLPRPCHL